jgi:hypothetical protein
MKRNVSRKPLVAVLLASILFSAIALTADAKKDKKADKNHPGPDSVVVFIGNRMFPDFADVVSTPLHRRCTVGDSEFSFEVLSFNPHFSIIDSTKTIVALSDEPKNPAFHIRVYKGGAAVDSSWAFYNLDVPHFSRTSALWFKVLCFDYRGVVYKKEPPTESQQEKPKDKKS